MWCVYYQAKEDLKEITHKVYFDVEIDGKEAGMIFNVYFFLFPQILISLDVLIL